MSWFGAWRHRLVQRFWSRRFRSGVLRTWMHEPAVRRYINASITGNEHRWPMDWFRQEKVQQPFGQGLSLGCGEGSLERDVVSKGVCTNILGLDLAPAAVENATALAQEAGLEGITYRLGNMNHLELPKDTYDIVFFHQSLHHVENLETCLAAVRKSLKPGGVLYLDEYIGPSRNHWRRPLIAEAERAYQQLPDTIRRSRQLSLPIDWRDPSEAVRSAEIIEQLKRHFKITERRDYGGNFLSVIHPLLKPEILSKPEGEQALREIITAEKKHLAAGAESYYTVLQAEPLDKSY